LESAPSSGNLEEETIVESGEHLASEDPSDLRRASRSSALHTASVPRRSAQSQRSRPRSSRTGALASAVSRLEQEHVALLMALCELEEPSAGSATNAEPMREALFVLLREELRHTQHALALAARGVYGQCEECHRPLSRRHLDLKPATTRCGICDARSHRTTVN
jgi:DnaK suppressor protein